MNKKPVYKCVKCGGHVALGFNGFLHGLSLSPDGDLSFAIKSTLRAVHYAEDCGKPNAAVDTPKLRSSGPDEENAR